MPNPDPLSGPLTWSPEALDFGEVSLGASAQRTLTLSNPNSAPVVLEALTVTSSVFALESTSTVLGPGADLNLPLRFRPGRLGRAVGELRIETDARERPVLQIALLGVGVDRSLCDDANPCTEDLQDPVSGACSHRPSDGTCDDGSACTFDDVCQAGVCVGQAVVCDDGVACTDDRCDPRVGCGFVPDDARCADQDPCTLDRCQADGCHNPTAPEGHPCGEVLSCVHQDVCQAGRCVREPIPEGAPCSDLDRCTLADRCAQGACVGTATVTPGRLLATHWSLGESFMATFAEGHLYVTPFDTGFAPRWVIMSEASGTWAPVAEAPVGIFGAAEAFPLGNQRYARVSSSTISRDRVEVLDLSVPLAPRRIAARILPTDNEVAMGLGEDQLYFCGPGGLGSVDLSDPTQPGPVVFWSSEICRGGKASGGGFVASWVQAEQPGAQGGIDTIGTLRIERLGRNGPTLVLNHSFTIRQTMPSPGVMPLGAILRVALDGRRVVVELANFNRFLVVDLEAANPSAVLVELAALGPSTLAGVAEAVAYLSIDYQLRAVDLTDPLQPVPLGYALPLSEAMEPLVLLDRDGDRLAFRANNGRLLIAPRTGSGVVASEDVRGHASFERLYPTSAGLLATSVDGLQLLRPMDLIVPTIPQAPQLESPWFEGPGFVEATLIDGPDGPLGLYLPSSNLLPDHLLPSVQVSAEGATTMGPAYHLEGRAMTEVLEGVAFEGCVGLGVVQSNLEVLLLDRCLSADPTAISSQPVFDADGRSPCRRGERVSSLGGGYFSLILQDAVVLFDVAAPASPRIIEVPWTTPDASCSSNALALDGAQLAVLDDLAGSSRLRTFDLFGPNLTPLRTSVLPNPASRVWLRGHRAYLSDGSRFRMPVDVLDLRPDPPALVERWVLPGAGVVDLEPYEGLLYLASSAGLNVVEPGCEGP